MKQLDKSLSLSAVVMFGLAYMTPIIVLGTYGVMADSTHGVVAGAYLLALIAILLTARSYGLMAREFPSAGSAYTYARKSINPKLGFLVGWAVLLDYVFLPMVIWLFGAVYLNSMFPNVPNAVWILGFIVITTAINIFGIKLANVVNNLMMIFQIGVLIAFVLLAIHYVLGDPRLSIFSLAPFYQSKVQLSLVVAGAAIACYSFLGFDAVTTLTEETKNPGVVIPRAIFLITLIGGGIFIATAYFVGLAHPGFAFQASDAAAVEIAKNIGGDLFVTIFILGLIIGQFASGLSAQASASRILYAMGRDGVLPKAFFGSLHERYQTPILNLILCGVIALLALFMDVSTSVSFINFGAFVAFTSLNLSVIARFYVGKKLNSPLEVWQFLIFPALGAAADFGLLINLDQKAITLGIVWLVLGIIYLAYLTNAFRNDPPEMDFAEMA